MAKYRLLTESSAKIVKSRARRWYTVALHLAPFNISGWNVCPMASEGCRASCLNTAGRGGIAVGGRLTPAEIRSGERTNRIQDARIRRTARFFEDRAAFLADLVADIRAAVKVARAKRMRLAVRLNATSDLRWESTPVDVDGFHHPSIMSVFPNVQFYDYTKIPNRKRLPSNYHLTFSLSECNETLARGQLANGRNVAVVFRSRDGIPAEYFGRPTVDGDDHDLRFLDPSDPAGFVVALYAKGAAIHDESGFVRD